MRFSSKVNSSYYTNRFSEIIKLKKEYKGEPPLIDFGIGEDKSFPDLKIVSELIIKNNRSCNHKYTDRGISSLHDSILLYLQNRFGVSVTKDEIALTMGTKQGLGIIPSFMLDDGDIVATTKPGYVVLEKVATLFNAKIIALPLDENNNFLPDLSLIDEETWKKVKILSLNYPNNPTGAVYTHEQLKEWVDYALENDAILLFDSAYECFITDSSLPRSIYSVEGSKKCAIEFCSLSKTAGFTGIRCGYTIVPKKLKFDSSNGSKMSLNHMWNRRQTTKFNGVSYIVQKGAAAVFTEEGMAQCLENIKYYQENARIIANGLEKNGIRYFGGINSPYIWFECPNHMDSWNFFDYLLENAQIVGTPGAGFGKNGQKYFRLTSFGNRENTLEAMDRIDKLFSY